MAAILAAMLVASVLAVVAGSPAQAANTSKEGLVDHDQDPKTDMVREFAGQDRYDTAIRLAKNFASNRGGLGSVSDVFIASGETLVDSISAAGLAGYVDAPILLTPSDRLHAAVADFIEDYGVGTVHVLGGPAAVSDSVVTAIEGLANKPTVPPRLAGLTRYETAAVVSGMIDSVSSWCGTDAASAILISGAAEALPFGVAMQPYAYRLQLPVLMTAADELPDATADFIDASGIEHVQIIGDEGVVSDAVRSALVSLGVDTVERVEGASAAEASVALANTAMNGCGNNLSPVSPDNVVLVRGNPDGVAAGPVLASSLDEGNLVLPLIVGDTLPVSVSDYLAATPQAVGDKRLALTITAIGGTAAVSKAVMQDALDAAASSGTLTASIGAASRTDGMPASASDPVYEGNMFALYFSDDIPAAVSGSSDTDIAAEHAKLLARIQDIIEVDGVPVRVTDVTTADDSGGCNARKVTVTLGSPLVAGQRIGVAPSAHTFGIDEDARTLAAVTPETVVKAPVDTTRPKVEIIGIVGEPSFQVIVTDPGALKAAEILIADELTLTTTAGDEEPATPVLTEPSSGGILATTKRAVWTVAVTDRGTLAAGDRLRVNADAITDGSGRTNAATSLVPARAAREFPAVSRVRMSEYKDAVQAAWMIPEASDTDAYIPTDATGVNDVTIKAKASGDAAGAAGNDWRIVLDTASGYKATLPLDIDVRVDTKGQVVSVRFVNGKATLGDLLTALNGSDEFAERFSVSTDCDYNPKAVLGPSKDRRGELVHFAVPQNDGTYVAGDANTTGAGRTQFAIEVLFSDYIEGSRADMDTRLLDDVLDRAAGRNRIEATGSSGLAELLGISSTSGSGAHSPYSKTVRFEMTATDVAHLPKDNDRVVTHAPTGDTSSAAEGTAVAKGYADDDGDAEDGFEELNPYSSVLIDQTASIKARLN